LQLFDTDTLLNCDSPVVRTVSFTLELCSYPKILRQFVRGLDSLDYDILQGVSDSLSGHDSARISFHPRSSGPQSGEYVIVLEDGTQIAVPLTGFGRGIVFVEPTSISVELDTIGGDASLPLSISGLPKKEVTEVVVQYDPKLLYLGTFSNDGVQLDIPGEQWAGRSKLHLDTSALRIDTASGAMRFTVFPDGDTCFAVKLDSFVIINPASPCIYALGSGTTQQICPPRGCSVMTITNFLRYHRPPQFRIFPNPSAGTFTLRSDIEVGAARLTLSDAAGTLLLARDVHLHRGENSIDVGAVASGWYILRVTGPELDAQAVISIAK
jgi:hypothetical protein